MKTTWASGTVIALAMMAACAASAADSVVLKDEVYVKGPKILIRDVADVQGENAEAISAVELGSAALPGASRRFDIALVASRIRTANAAPQPVETRGARSVCATTMHNELNREAIGELVKTFIESQIPWNPQDTEITVTPPADNVLIPEGEVRIDWRPEPQYRYLGVGAVRGTVVVDGEIKKTVLCKVSIETYADVVVARAEIPRGKTIAASDLETEKRPLSPLKETVFHDPSELGNYVARTPIAPGQIITPHSVAPRQVVKRNQTVVVETRAGGLRVQTEARAVTDAGIGDMVTCVNPNSKLEFMGLVRSDGIVVVE